MIPANRQEKLSVVLFSGGSGTQSISEAFLKHPQISLTILINAYDDGHSTGRLRRFIPGMLGPSDVRKNINRLMPKSDERHRALRFLSDQRLPVGMEQARGMEFVQRIANAEWSGQHPELTSRFEQLSVKQAATFARFFRAFRQYCVEQAVSGNFFDFTDCALGNILFAGCYLEENRDFNRTVDAFGRFYEIESRLLNVTQGENLFLIARKEDGEVLWSEAEIVSAQNPSKIDDIFLIGDAVYRSALENPPAGCLDEFLASAVRTPSINPEAKQALESADVIVYGPGTQHSSLFPSYLTRGVAEAIIQNHSADKILISNIRRDFDMQEEDAGDLARKFLAALSRKGEVAVHWRDAVTHSFFQNQDRPQQSGEHHGVASYIPFDATTFSFPLESVMLRDWEDQEGRHAGGFVLDELQQIVQSRIDIALQPFRHLISIVVPALNEERSVEETLKRLLALDFQLFELGKEIIFVDGASSDRTFEIASSVRNVKAYRLDKPEGRGAALRAGIEKARGDIIVFFPADLEYQEKDIYPVVLAIARSNFSAVFGTRAVKCTDLSGRLKSIYGKARGLYLVSKY
ncbi:MAG TPA: 2-phospho-L-lactate transferase CofD family protein, partial [Bryobacteraceae bacterium]|nr:2-phospho-L-lactate transferase CofD family protein [Bryobacteraceae bacterium]